jgi:hypothetical protein
MNPDLEHPICPDPPKGQKGKPCACLDCRHEDWWCTDSPCSDCDGKPTKDHCDPPDEAEERKEGGVKKRRKNRQQPDA